MGWCNIFTILTMSLTCPGIKLVSWYRRFLEISRPNFLRVLGCTERYLLFFLPTLEHRGLRKYHKGKGVPSLVDGGNPKIPNPGALAEIFPHRVAPIVARALENMSHSPPSALGLDFWMEIIQNTESRRNDRGELKNISWRLCKAPATSKADVWSTELNGEQSTKKT